MNSILHEIPNMNNLLEHQLFSGIERGRVKRAAQSFLDELRGGVLSGDVRDMPAIDECARRVLSIIDDEKQTNLRGLINATGVVLHTNLGRAPLGVELCAGIAEICSGYCNLEYNLETGSRGSRYAHVEELICELSGAQAALVVNNNAAATYLMLAALLSGKRVAVSRGELVEIGGSMRVPEIMEQSGAELVEVGTTNKTRLSDYVNAVEKKGVKGLLKVHTSNYEIVGFTESVTVSELAAYGKENGLPVLYDMGSCFLVEPELLGLRVGETAPSGIKAGADIICFSGDKLLGSTQAGVLAGRADYISAMKSHPITRMVRPDKFTLAALEASLQLYRYPGEAIKRIPVLAMLSAKPEELRRRAADLAQRFKELFAGWEIEVRETEDETGGGSLPNVQLPGWAVALKPSGMSVAELERRLRLGRIPVIIRIQDGMALVSLRTLTPAEEGVLLEAFRAIYTRDR